MAKYRYLYLVHIQYLGFRFHGWQKQKDVKTIHEMIDKTLWFVFGNDEFKTMGSSRTDAKVSVQHSVFELFLNKPLGFADFLEKFNSNLPADIRAIKVEETNSGFNIIQSSKLKEYHYYFASGAKAHPYSAAFVTTVPDRLDISLMQQGAALFLGEHHFDKYCTQPRPGTEFIRNIEQSEVLENDVLTASFFPEETYVYKVSSKGFMRNQVRLMMGQLFELGKGNTSLDGLQYSVSTVMDKKPLTVIAPASGLHLIDIQFSDDTH
ncbi:MAG: tRNA pseudouridine(38-40) synthase TruA [Crocinitomicaceae bacterium]|mgnify:CR=1 FL=1|nr:tRNA pseudouridine(38-40) synthase TruA [Crocinitomicaceae bacterium]|tara:strand:+ start:3184 stop:3978 length:795 start_codon:yes stop_codon:yes gene_type:complete